MSNQNKHGLSRKIPEDTRRSVRQRCGFGCVICGLAISQYKHLDPSFSEAKEHDPNNIVLLCGSCHDRVTRRIWSKESDNAHYMKQAVSLFRSFLSLPTLPEIPK